MHIILTGTGLVGAIALDAMLNDEAIDKITIVSRKPVPQAEGQAKVTVIVQKDLAVYSDEILEKLKGAHGCIWTAGPPLMAVTRQEYEYAHIELPVIAAKIFATLNDKFNFVYVSHDGCHDARAVWIFDVKARAEERLFQLHHDTSKRLTIKTKGGIEEEEALPSLVLYCIRPALIDYSQHEAIKPWLKPLPLAKKWTNGVILPLYRFLGLTSILGSSEELGQAMKDLVICDGQDVDVAGASPEGRCMGAVGMRNWTKERDDKMKDMTVYKQQEATAAA
uniref:NAD(P)-binding domain-containing protein n=1 Tax=Tolypocladium ophioglossoides (strain CBS 100239) TaxID=1163406 RepID=A0A0L0MYM9_TOLOC